MFRRLVVALFVVTALSPVLFITRLYAEDTATTTVAQSAQPSAPQSKTERMLGGTPQDIQLTAEEQQFVELTNADRKAEGLSPLTVAPLLVRIAREKSKEMHDLNYWGHESPIPEKRTAMRRVLYYLPEAPKSMVVGENLFYCSKVRVEDGEKALMNSPTHRRNILNPEYTYVGIGTYIAPNGEFWTTAVFLSIQY